MTRADLRPLAICLVLAVGAELLAPVGSLVPVLLLLILLGGMPHGGLDLLLASRRFALSRPRHYAIFSLAYLGLAGVVALAWFMLPSVALTIFLAYSALHFGSDWEDQSIVAAWAIGLALLAQPAIAWPDETTRLFSGLGADGAIVRLTLVTTGLVALPFVLWVLRRRLLPAAVFVGLAGLSVLLHPLAWFFVYFCGVHGPRHIKRVGQSYAMSFQTLRQHWIGPTVVAGLCVLITGVILWPYTGLESAAMRAVFIGFAALTVPHMLLVDLYAHHRSQQTQFEA